MVRAIHRFRRKKILEIQLSQTPDFEKPNENLEQYKTPPEIAADIAWNIVVERKMSKKIIIDLGCGTGSLCFSFLFLEAPYCICLDIDDRGLNKAKKFGYEKGFDGNIDFILNDVGYICLRENIKESMVVMNPPWGTREKGLDSVFLRKAMEISDRFISIHALPRKTNNNYIVRLIEKNNWKIIKSRIIDFPIKASLPHHKKRVHKTRALIIEACRDEEQH